MQQPPFKGLFMISVSKKNKNSQTIIKSDTMTIRLNPKNDHLLGRMINVLKGIAAPSKTFETRQPEGVKMTKFEIVMNALQSKKTGFTLSQLASKARTTPGTVSARIAEMRSMGYAIQGTSRSGTQVYTLASSTRSKSVANAYAKNGVKAFR